MFDINIIIYSFNRALQLDTLIRSINRYLRGCSYVINVIYNSTSSELEQGYEYLKKSYPNNWNVNFLKETRGGFKGYSFSEYCCVKNLKTLFKNKSVRNPKSDFRQLNISAIRNTNSRYVVFFTDDSVMIKDCFINDNIMSFIDANPMQNSYSMRQGLNVDDGFFAGCKKGDYLYWNYNQHPFESHWGYHFSVDGHIYSKQVADYLMRKIIFANPNTMEGPIAMFAKQHNLLQNGMSNTSTCLLAFPLNEVNNEVANYAQNISCEMLNEKLLSGYQLNYDIPADRDIERFPQFKNCVFFEKDGVSEKVEIYPLHEFIIKQASTVESARQVEADFVIITPQAVCDNTFSDIQKKLNEYYSTDLVGIVTLKTLKKKDLFVKDALLTSFDGINDKYIYCLRKDAIVNISSREGYIRCFNKSYLK